MLELLLTAAVIAAAVYTVSALGPQLAPPASAAHLTAGTDLPCPWCLAATDEDDAACPSCAQLFGPAHAIT